MNALFVMCDLMRVKEVSKLSGFCYSETFFTAGEPCQGSGPEKPLQVYNGVEFSVSKAANKRDKRGKGIRMEPGLAKELAIKDNNIIEMRVVFEQRSELRANEPSNVCIR
jgi:hypothetical protein